MTLYEYHSQGPLRCMYHVACGRLIGWTVAHPEYELPWSRIVAQCGECGRRLFTGHTFTLAVP